MPRASCLSHFNQFFYIGIGYLLYLYIFYIFYIGIGYHLLQITRYDVKVQSSILIDFPVND